MFPNSFCNNAGGKVSTPDGNAPYNGVPYYITGGRACVYGSIAAKCGKWRLRRRLWRHKKEIIQEDLWCHNIKLWAEFEIEHNTTSLLAFYFFENTMQICVMCKRYKVQVHTNVIMTIFICIFISKQQALDTGYTQNTYEQSQDQVLPIIHNRKW